MAGMKSWSTTAANNVLANTGFTMDEGQAPSTLNDSIRQAMADIRTEWAQGANIASAATVDLSAATGGYVHITGAVTITAFGTVSAGIRRKITFDGALTLTHNATSLILPTSASIVTVAGDTCEAMSEGSGNWRVLWYSGKNVQATIVNATTSVVTPLVGTDTAVNLALKYNGVTQFNVNSSGFFPAVDNTSLVGSAASRIAQFTGPILDTGTTGSGALKTNNGTTVLTWANDLSVKPVGLLDLTTASAGQIGFPAAQNASAGANVLDDYEEGTWTPSVGGSATYTTQVGTYTKIGRMVAIVGTVTINSIGTGSTTTISGLPFTSAANTAISVSNGTSLATNMVSVTAGIPSGFTTIVFNGRTVASASESSSAIFGNSAGVNFAGIYFV